MTDLQHTADGSSEHAALVSAAKWWTAKQQHLADKAPESPQSDTDCTSESNKERDQLKEGE